MDTIHTERIKALKNNMPQGTRVKLMTMNDPYSSIPTGTLGTVSWVDDRGTVQVDWDNGSHLGLIEGEDSWIVLPNNKN